VLWAVATGVGFIAAFNGEIDEHEAQSILTRLKANANSAVAAAAEEAEADIEHFVGHRQRGEDVELVERLPEDWLLQPFGPGPAENWVPVATSNIASITLDSGSFSDFKTACANASVPCPHSQ